MISKIQFTNFRALREASLPLGRFTLIVGPNGSGKSTAMQAFEFARQPSAFSLERIVTAGSEQASSVEVVLHWTWDESPAPLGLTKSGWRRVGSTYQTFGPEAHPSAGLLSQAVLNTAMPILKGFRLFSFDAQSIAQPVQTRPNAELAPNGANLAAVLDALTDTEPERYEALNRELYRWLPEFDRILFETPSAGYKGLILRTTVGRHRYHAADLSHGTLFALAILTIGYLPSPPPIVCFEEPDRGIHPRLLVDIKDAMYRLAFPEKYGESRQPVQVIATTHSPYLLDLYKEHPEEIVIAHKDENGAHFERLSEKEHIAEILEGAPLGDIWFSGILGGVPASP
jgi:predicted ATPase